MPLPEGSDFRPHSFGQTPIGGIGVTPLTTHEPSPQEPPNSFFPGAGSDDEDFHSRGEVSHHLFRLSLGMVLII